MKSVGFPAQPTLLLHSPPALCPRFLFAPSLLRYAQTSSSKENNTLHLWLCPLFFISPEIISVDVSRLLSGGLILVGWKHSPSWPLTEGSFWLLTTTFHRTVLLLPYKHVSYFQVFFFQFSSSLMWPHSETTEHRLFSWSLSYCILLLAMFHAADKMILKKSRGITRILLENPSVFTLIPSG